jgi:hypothetical protein
MRFQVPQFVDIEDKVIGPLTLKQFAFYIIAVMVLGILYVIVDLGLLILLALPIVGVAVLFAHGRFYGQSFGSLVLNTMNFFSGTRLYLWRRAEKDKPLKVSGSEYAYGDEAYSASSIDLMNQVLNTEGNVVEEDAADPLVDEDKPDNGGKAETEEKDKEVRDNENPPPEMSKGSNKDV